MNRIAACITAALLLLAPLCASAQGTRPQVASTLPAGWEEIDQRLVFFTMQLASVEASLDAVNKAIRQAGYTQAQRQGQAAQFQKNNELMDRQGGGPTSWKEFYGKTAEHFFHHADIEVNVTKVKELKPTSPDNLSQTNLPGPASLRPPQFDYIYRANQQATKRAEAEVSKLGGKVDALIDRRRELEKEQASIWAKIAFQAISSRKLGTRPVYRFDLKVAGADDVATQRQEALRSGAAFVRKVLRAAADAQGVIDNDPEATFAALQRVVGEASDELSDRLIRSPKLAMEAGDTSTLLGRIAASAERMTSVTRNIAESYSSSIRRDQTDDSQKQTFRAFTQSSLFDLAANISTTADYVTQLSRDWKAEIDVTHPVSTTAPSAVASVLVNPQAKVSPTSTTAQPPTREIDLLPTMRGNTGRRENGAIVLKAAAKEEKITSDQAFVPPVRFKIVAMIDGGDLRFSYAADQIIFHWANRPSELRIDGGPRERPPCGWRRRCAAQSMGRI